MVSCNDKEIAVDIGCVMMTSINVEWSYNLNFLMGTFKIMIIMIVNSDIYRLCCYMCNKFSNAIIMLQLVHNTAFDYNYCFVLSLLYNQLG